MKTFELGKGLIEGIAYEIPLVQEIGRSVKVTKVGVMGKFRIIQRLYFSACDGKCALYWCVGGRLVWVYYDERYYRSLKDKHTSIESAPHALSRPLPTCDRGVSID